MTLRGHSHKSPSRHCKNHFSGADTDLSTDTNVEAHAKRCRMILTFGMGSQDPRITGGLTTYVLSFQWSVISHPFLLISPPGVMCQSLYHTHQRVGKHGTVLPSIDCDILHFHITELVSEELLDCGIAILVAGCFWDGVKQQVVSHAAPRQVDQRIMVGLRCLLLLGVVTAQFGHPRLQLYVLPLQFRDALMAEFEYGFRQIRHLND